MAVRDLLEKAEDRAGDVLATATKKGRELTQAAHLPEPAALGRSMGLGFAPALSGVVAQPDEWYDNLQKPRLNPPAWVFGPVWFTLYALSGLAHARYSAERTRQDKRTGHLLFGAQQALNAAWPIVFFRARAPRLALANIGLLLAGVFGTMRAFSRVSRPAARMLWPYALWVAFAAYLNGEIVRLNRR